MSSTFVQRGAQGYDWYMGRWSRRLAPLFVNFAGIAPHERVLDVGCGTGSLALELALNPTLTAIECVDYEDTFVQALRERASDPRIHAQQGDACALPFRDASFDRALSLLVLHFVSDPLRAAAEMHRILRPGGIAAAATWDLFGGFPRLFWDTVAAIDPSLDARRGPMVLRPTTQPGELAAIFAKAGFVDVEESMLAIRLDFASFDDYWNPLISGQGSLEQLLANLSVTQRELFHSRVRAAYLCNQPDGPRSRAAVAWAVKGRVPEG